MFQSLLEAGRDRNIALKIAQNIPSRLSPNIDTVILAKKANAQVRFHKSISFLFRRSLDQCDKIFNISKSRQRGSISEFLRDRGDINKCVFVFARIFPGEESKFRCLVGRRCTSYQIVARRSYSRVRRLGEYGLEVALASEGTRSAGFELFVLSERLRQNIRRKR